MCCQAVSLLLKCLSKIFCFCIQPWLHANNIDNNLKRRERERREGESRERERRERREEEEGGREKTKEKRGKRMRKRKVKAHNKL